MSQFWTFGYRFPKANVSILDIWLSLPKGKCLNFGHLVIASQRQMSQFWTFGYRFPKANVSILDIWLSLPKIKCLNFGHLVITPLEGV
jgi:hypothetical protein